MKPRTKFQKKVVEVSVQLKKISSIEKAYAFKHCLNHDAIRLKSGKVSCLDCGHSWMEPVLKEFYSCPSCRTKLKTVESRKRKFRDLASFQIFTTIEDFQVIRMFEVGGWYNVGKKSWRYTKEVSRIFINEEGKFEVIGYNFNAYYISWWGEFSLKNKNSIGNHDRKAYKIYPKIKVLSKIERNGFKNEFHDVTPFSFFKAILVSNKMETLLKTNQLALFRFFISSYSYNIDEFWLPIKVCIRNKYLVSDTEVSIWIDYIEKLKEFGKDLNSPFYVCPADLKKAHDKYVEKSREKRRKERLLKIKQEIEEYQKEYSKNKKKFFGLEFQKDNITIKVFETVQDFMIEGDMLKHCVFENKYFQKESSLLLSARVNQQVTETVEVCLKTFKILQSRGYDNETSSHHKEIVEIVAKNMELIKERLNPKKRKKKDEVVV